MPTAYRSNQQMNSWICQTANGHSADSDVPALSEIRIRTGISRFYIFRVKDPDPIFQDIRQDLAYIRNGIRPKKAKPLVFRIRTGYFCGSGLGILI